MSCYGSGAEDKSVNLTFSTDSSSKNAGDAYDVVISYSRADSEFALCLEKSLEGYRALEPDDDDAMVQLQGH